jgi:hypothetical protein
MSREQVFNTEIKKFFDVCTKILESHSKSFLGSSGSNVLRNLQRYQTVYNMTDVETHIPYFQKMFRSYRDDILNVLRDDKWLQDENVVIQFGEELEDSELKKRSAKRKIEVSSIYKSALQLRKSAEESLKGLPEIAQERCQELIYPEIFLLHIFRILSAIYPQNKELQRNIQVLEKDLGCSLSKKSGTPLESLAENAKQLLSGVLPGNFKIPSNEEINQKFESAMKDPLVSETLGTTVNSLMNAKNLSEGIGLAMKSLENPKFMDGLMKAVQTMIPPETLETIVKSTESLKDSGDVKDALNKLGINGDVDVKSLISNFNISDLLKNQNVESTIVSNTIDNTKQPDNTTQNDNIQTEPAQINFSSLSNLSIEEALSTLKKNISPDILDALQKQSASNSSTKSLIDF